MDLSIIIVSWKVKEKLIANLSALFNSELNFRYEVFVVDNNSGDGSVEMIRSRFPLVKLRSNSDNLGFAAANNQALRECSGKYILLLNPDMCVAPDTLANMLAWAEKNQQAVVSGCKLINEDRTIIRHVRRFPKLLDQLAVTLKFPHLFPGIINKYLCADFDYSQATRVDSIRGAFFMINREAFQRIGGSNPPLLDERYFIWFEEVDFCRTVHELGGEVWYTPAAECLDYVGQSFAQLKRGLTQKYFSDSMIKYFQKWQPKPESQILALAWQLVRMFL